MLRAIGSQLLLGLAHTLISGGVQLRFLIFAGIPLVVACPSHAQFRYTSTNGTVTITGYIGTNKHVVIPHTISGLPVTAIGFGAFEWQGNLVSVTIPDSVASLGNWAFYDCTNLTGVTISSSLTSIGDGAFYECYSLTNVTIPDSVTNIGRSAFYECYRLTSVPIPNHVTSIGDWAFEDCYGLTNVTIPDRVTSIGDGAFEECYSLTNVTIPDSVTSIGVGAFSGCLNLAAITVDSASQNYSSIGGVLFDKGHTTLIRYPPAKAGASYAIPDTVTSIENATGDGAFADCGLSSITLPSSVTNIVEPAFSYCRSLESISVDALNPSYSSVDGILLDKSQRTIIQCPGGKAGAYKIPNNVTSIGDSAFEFCSALTNVTIPSSVTNLGNLAFDSCTSLTSVIISDGVSNIGDGAFGGCTNLTSVTIPSSVTSIGESVFEDCYGLTNVTISSCLTSIGDSAFEFCSALTNVTIPNSVTNLGNLAFDGCTSLTSVIISDGVSNIGDAVFADCSSLTSITIPGSVTNIGARAFSGCAGLTKVFFGGNAPAVGGYVFAGGVVDFGTLHWDLATVYFLLGTAGWSTNFAGLPTAIWTPEVQTADRDFGVKSNQFGFNITWAASLSVIVEASPSLGNPAWSPVATNALSGGTFYFTDPQWTNYPSRFYRVRSQ
jgi:hypothetical protein